MRRALFLLLVPSLALAAPQYDALTKIELGGMTGTQAGKSSAHLARFMQNREPVVQRNMGLFVGLAKRILAAQPATLHDPTAAQADRLFTQLAAGRLGTDVPDDYCFMRAEVAARMLQRQGFAVQKVNAIATAGRSLTVETTNTVDDSTSWRYHVAPLVHVGGTDYVLDPSLGKAKMTLRGWKAKMHERGMETLVTGSDQLSFSTQPAATTDDKVQQLARSLAQLGGIRAYERFRARALATVAR